MIRLSLFLIAFLLFCACARQTTPNGGPQDKIPPKLVRSSPDNNEKNFKGNTITLTFNEAVKLKEPKEEIIIAPSPGKEILFLAKQNRITVEFKTGLKDSTTYSIAFREAVQDLTESNPAENLRLAFSTGPIIDSLTIKGNVVDALTEKIPQNITVAIYQADTFNIFKHTPAYFTKTNKQGRFVITNLKAGSYRLYAFDDKNKNLKLETKSEKFGFIPGQIDPTKNVDSVQIIMVSLDARPLHLSNVRNTDKYSRVKFNKSLSLYSVDIPGNKILNAFGDDQSEIKFFYPTELADSLAATIHGTDSLGETIDTLVYIKSGKNGPPPDPFKIDLQPITINTETGILNTTLAVNKPIRKITLDSVFLRLDSLTVIPFTPDEFRYDTLFNQIEINKNLDKKIITNTNAPIQFYMSANTLISIENDSSKRIVKPITIPKPEETATLLLEVQTNKTEFVVQLLTTDNKIVRSVRNTKKIVLKNLLPTNYKVRVLFDENKNNKWDPGNINKDIPPEKTIFYKNSDRKYQFPIRANWEIGPYIISF